MPFGQPPFIRDFMDRLIERRLGLQKPEVETLLRSDAMTPYEGPGYATGAASMAPKKPGLLRSAVSEGLSDTGQEAFGAGMEAGLGQRNFGGALAASFGASVGKGAKLRKAEKANEAEMGMKERALAADEKRADASMISAKKERAPGRTKLGDLQETQDFLMNDLGWDDQQISDYFKRQGAGGGGRGGNGTDRFRLATALFQSGKAKTMPEAEIAAATMMRAARPVGSISKVIVDPDTFSSTTVRQVVSQALNPFTQQMELIDEQGNVVKPEELEQFRGGNFITGTGGEGRQPPAGNTPPAISDFQGNGTMTEDQVLNLLDGAKVREVIQAYAAGKGPLGNSTAIKQKAAQMLQGMSGVQMVPSHGQANGLGG